jgi:hypothetical protein
VCCSRSESKTDPYVDHKTFVLAEGQEKHETVSQRFKDEVTDSAKQSALR